MLYILAVQGRKGEAGRNHNFYIKARALTAHAMMMGRNMLSARAADPDLFKIRSDPVKISLLGNHLPSPKYTTIDL